MAGHPRRLQTNYAGTPELSCSGGSFGDLLNCVAVNNAADVTELHFTGKERDQESGNDNFGARSYSSTIGRFISSDYSDDPDPTPYADYSNPQSLNLYSYVLNDPLVNVDVDDHTCGGDTIINYLYDGGGNLLFSGLSFRDNPCAPLSPRNGTDASRPRMPHNPGNISQNDHRARGSCPSVPPHLPSMNLSQNLANSAKHKYALYTFYMNVRGHGSQDYKQNKTLNTDVPGQKPFAPSSLFEDFGNFNYGATGAAQGYNLPFLLRAAGYAGQMAQGNSIRASAKKALGPAPYGDDPTDQVQIQNGYSYYNMGCSSE